MITIGLTHTSKMVVTEAMTAKNMGSGDMPVLASPAMIALMENAALLAVANELEAGYTTVGVLFTPTTNKNWRHSKCHSNSY